LTLEAAKEAGGAYIAWGPFAQTTFDFLIIAFAIFMIIKLMNKAQSMAEGEKPVEEEAPKEIPEDIQLLRDIRDSLAK
jgi:large conductance mechanosensitive channel